MTILRKQSNHTQPEDNGEGTSALRKLVYICDWLPPDFGAVGQYSLQFARERAANGEDVLLVGLSSEVNSRETEEIGAGRLRTLRIQAAAYDRNRLLRRALWTLRVNTRLLWRVRRELRTADEILFTGSPPYLLHFLAPLNILLRKRLVYRIADFHPECLMAGRSRTPLLLKLLYRLTLAWRRRIGEFEVLGEDQRTRLLEIGIRPDRIRLKRDPSPVTIAPDTAPLPRPPALDGYRILLYSGNFGVAHDHETFVEGYRRHHSEGTGRVGLWLNAVGAKADLVEQLLRDEGLPVHRSQPVPLDLLPRLLVTPDAHLITLHDHFVGFVMPSKVYGCLQSRRDILYVGSTASDVHLLCSQHVRLCSPHPACSPHPPQAYYQVPVGRPDEVAQALESIADHAARNGRSRPPALTEHDRMSAHSR